MAEVPVRREVIVAVDGKDDYSWQVVDWALRTVVREDDLVCVLQVVPCTPQHVEVLHGEGLHRFTLQCICFRGPPSYRLLPSPRFPCRYALCRRWVQPEVNPRIHRRVPSSQAQSEAATR